MSRSALCLGGLAIGLLLALPAVLSSYAVTVFIFIFFYGYLGQAWNILGGYGGQLSAGWIEKGAVVCPLHGYKFDLTSGACATNAKLKAKIFKLAAQGDNYTVEG